MYSDLPTAHSLVKWTSCMKRSECCEATAAQLARWRTQLTWLARRICLSVLCDCWLPFFPPRTLYRNSYWVCHLTAKGKDGTGSGICLSVLCVFHKGFSQLLKVLCQEQFQFAISLGLAHTNNVASRSIESDPFAKFSPNKLPARQAHCAAL
jgi:hypothetical protein